MLNPFSWSLDGWFLFLQIVAFAILGATVAVGYFLSTRQARQILALETQLSEARTKQFETEKSLLELRESQASRRLASTEFRAALKGKPTGEVAVLYDELTGIEGYLLASNIHDALQDAGWRISEFGPIPSDPRIPIPPIAQAGSYTGYGVTIITASWPETRPFTRDTPYSTLWNAFSVSSLKFDACMTGDPLPENSFRILVGKKPPLPCSTE